MRDPDITRRQAISSCATIVAVTATSGCGAILGGPDGAENALKYGDDITGSIESDGPRDPIYDDLSAQYAFEGGRGDAVRIAMTATEFDPFVVLTLADGTLVDGNDDSGGSRNADFTTLLPETATYHIWAGSFSGEATGSFSLVVEDRTGDWAGPPASAGTIDYDETVQGEVNTDSPGDPRWDDPSAAYTFDGSRGDRVRISMDASAFDPFVVVSGPQGGVVAYTNDGPEIETGPIEATLPVDGTYTIWAGSLSGTGVGSFSLTLERA